MKSVFLRVIEADDKAATLLESIRTRHSTSSGQRFEVNAARFASVPGSPFAYWVSDRLKESV